MPASTFSCSDSVATRLLLALIFAGTALVALVLPVLAWIRAGSLTTVVDTGLAGSLTIDDARIRPGVEATWPGTAEVRLEDPSAGVWAWQIAAGAALTLAVGVVTVLLIALLRRVQQGRPFSRSSVLLLRLTALTIIVGAVAVSLLGSIADATIIEEAFDRDTRSATLTLISVPEIVAFAVALVIAASADVVARGERLSQDVDGLV